MAQVDPITDPTPDTPAASSGCQRQPYCVLGAGHAGFCSRRTKEERAAAPAKRTRTRRPRVSAGSSSGTAPSATTRRPGRAAKSAMKPLIGLLWSGIGQALEQYAPEPGGPPAGRIMQFEAPYAADRLHPVLRKFPVYKRLDDATGGLFDDLGPLILAPVLGAVIASNDSARSMLMPLLYAQLEPMAVEMARSMKETRDSVQAVDGLTAEVAELMETLAAELFAPRVVVEDDDAAAHTAAAFA